MRDDAKILAALAVSYDAMLDELSRQTWDIPATESAVPQKPLHMAELEEIWKTIPRRPMLEVNLVHAVRDWSDDEVESLLGMLPLLKGTTVIPWQKGKP